jgi:hypothetical protein
MASQHHIDLVKTSIVEAGDSGPFAHFDRSQMKGHCPPRSDRQLTKEVAYYLPGRINKNVLSEMDQRESETERLRRK